ncbi:alpha/beta hydrolase fold domain-containing protein [Parapedobacter soli]|uniref:alpha/beta hydrolase fold domain-containing protein n=1 Tax=Parapedobacter soli TaxID=416955 RepID=UPI0021C97F28|nr:alpha/beta hydrolase [Parapedobacter soli]
MRTTIKILLTLFISTTMKAQTTDILDKVNNDRTFFETLGNIYPVSQNVKISGTQIAEVKCYWFTPKNEVSDNIIVYLHGGCFAFGSINSHKAMVSHIAENTRSKILLIEYSFAPENPFPVAINEIVKVYKELLKTYPNRKIIFMGDSAGGGLVVSGIYSIAENKLKLPSATILISSWLNLKCNTNSYKTRQSLDPFLTKPYLLEYAEYYVGNSENADPNELVFDSFPPTFLLTGTNEILYDDTKNFYDYIKTIQPNTAFKEYENQTHVWLLTDINSEKSKEALKDIADFVNGVR